MTFLRRLALILIPLLALVLGFGIGVRFQVKELEAERQQLEDLYNFAESGALVDGDPEKQVDLGLFWGVWRLLQKHYIDPADLQVQPMVFGAVSGLVEGVGDPYTLFMTPDDTKAFDDALSGTLEGIGAQLDQQEGRIVVVAPLKGSPAEKAGLQPKDQIVEVNEESIAGLRLDEVVSKIRGPRGTVVTLTVQRPGNAAGITLRVTRENIHIPSVEPKVEETERGKLGIIALNQFGDDSMEEVRKVLVSFPKDIKGIVLDLRFNGGGYLEGAVQLVSMFLKSGEVVTVERRDLGPEKHVVSGEAIAPDTPMVILVNAGSASAAEITAGALQDHGRAKVVGVQTFGKGTVQEIIDLPGGSALRVTVARWLTPKGRDITEKGVTPDIIVERTPEEQQAEKDPQMERALEELLP